MAQFRTFEDMHVWQEARSLVQTIRQICKRPSLCREWALIDQISRAARSISANIAEGSDTLSSAEFIRFLGYAKSSTAEVRSFLYDLYEEGHISKIEFNELSDQTFKIGGMLAKLIHHLQSPQYKQKRTFKRSHPPNN